TDGFKTGSATFAWSVTDVTTPQVTPPADQASRAGDTVSGVLVLGTDADGDPLTFSASNLPPGLMIDSGSGEITGSIAAQTSGTYLVTVSASDGTNTGTATFGWVVQDIVLTAPADQSHEEGDTITGIFVLATDADGDALTFSASNLPPGLAIDS